AGPRQRGGRRTAVQGAAAALAGDRVAAAVVGGRRVGERPVGVQGQGAVAGPADQDRRQRVALPIRVVAEHAGRADGQRRVLGRAVAVVDRRRRVVDRRHGKGDGGGVAVQGAV